MKRLISLVMLFSVISLAFSLAPECSAAMDGNIVLWLQFDEGTGTVARDSSNYGNDGTIGGATWVDGKYGSALLFDGVSNVVEVPSTDELQLSDQGLTIACWFKTTETSNSDLLLIEKGAWGTGEYGLSYPGYANNKVRFQLFEIFGKESNQIDSTSGVPELSDDEWHHTAGVYDAVNHNFKVYVDGILETEQDAADHVFTSDNESVFIGSRNNAGNWYAGAIDDLLIAKVALTESEINSYVDGSVVVTAVSLAGKLATKWGSIKNY